MEADPTLPMGDSASEPSGATCLAGRYQLGAPLGQGGMSAVYRAWDLESGDEVAVKVLHPRLTEESSRLRFAVEAVTMRFLFHPNSAAVLDMGVDEVTGASFVVLALASGG